MERIQKEVQSMKFNKILQYAMTGALATITFRENMIDKTKTESKVYKRMLEQAQADKEEISSLIYKVMIKELHDEEY